MTLEIYRLIMKRVYLSDEEKIKVEVKELSKNQVEFILNGHHYVVERNNSDFILNNYLYTAHTNAEYALVNGKTLALKVDRVTRSYASGSGKGDMKSPMPGKILKLCVADGSSVKVGDPLVIMEAMKMEHTIKATKNGVLTKMLVSEGQLVQGGKDLFEFEE